MRTFVLSGAISMALFSCQFSSDSPAENEAATPISLVGTLIQNDSSQVRFGARLEGKTLYIENGVQETLTIELTGEDTLKGTFPVFASDLYLVPTEEGYSGLYLRTDAEDYTLPLTLSPGELHFAPAQKNWPGQYAIQRHFGDGNTRPALLQLNKKDGVLVGTIATSTGDSRFLSGWETEEGFQLQGFDGRFIYNVVARVQGDSIYGDVWAGKTGYFSFVGVADEEASLEDPEHMTSLKEDYTHIEWHLPGLDGDTVHFDSRTLSKPTILTIQGSWCPNCMDEGRVLDEFYREFEGAVDVYGLSFEYSGTLDKALKAVQKMERDLGTTFPMVVATYSKDQDPNSVLPLERIRSYPTSLILDHEGKVVRIHTGFYGPSTKEFEGYVKETRALLTELVDRAAR